MTSRASSARPVRIGVVLSSGGLRGAAHLGVLRQLERHHIPFDVIVGVSAGAVIGAYYACVGLTVEEMVGDAPTFLGRHLLMHGLTLRATPALKPFLRRFSGVIPRRLSQLEGARFDKLHHGVQQFGVVCHDIERRQAVYFSTADDRGARLNDVVKASAALPGVLPPAVLTFGGRQYRLADGGLSDSLPIPFARSPELGATHLIVSDCRLNASPPVEPGIVYIRPSLEMGSFRAPRATLMAAVRAGEAAVTSAMIEEIKSWTSR